MRKSNFRRGFEHHHDFPPAHICSAEVGVCANPAALQFVGSKQEVSLAIKVLFSMVNGPKNNNQICGEPAPTHVWAGSGPQEAQWSTVHGAYLSRVSLCRECSGEETQRSQRGQTSRDEEKKLL